MRRSPLEMFKNFTREELTGGGGEGDCELLLLLFIKHLRTLKQKLGIQEHHLFKHHEVIIVTVQLIFLNIITFSTIFNVSTMDSLL